MSAVISAAGMATVIAYFKNREVRPDKYTLFQKHHTVEDVFTWIGPHMFCHVYHMSYDSF